MYIRDSDSQYFYLFIGFTLDSFMKENSMTAFDQIKGLVLDELKESLGLPQYLNDPPCSLSSQMYTPQIKGFKNCTWKVFV